MVDCLLLGAWRGSFFWTEVGYDKDTELNLSYSSREPRQGLESLERNPVVMNVVTELIMFWCSNDATPDWDLGGSSLIYSLRSIDRHELWWYHRNAIASCNRIVLYIMYVYMDCFVVFVLEGTYQRSFVESLDGISSNTSSHCVGLVLWGIMVDYDILLID